VVQRVVAGQLRGRRLRALPSAARDVRPSSSKVRGAVFDRLQREVVGARVLDLCAGSGALAIEALSRGAAHAVLVERSTAMVAYLRAALTELDLVQRCDVWLGDVARVVEAGRPSGLAPFDLVLFDPPYEDVLLYPRVLSALVARAWLATDAVVVVEWSVDARRSLTRRSGHSASDPIELAPVWGPGWILDARREHGGTTLDFLHRDVIHTDTSPSHLGDTP